MSHPFLSSDDFAADNLARIASLVRFLEESAGNHADCVTPRAHGYSSEAWAGMQEILELIRTSLEELALKLPLE